MNSDRIRRGFLDFFKERGHTAVPSSFLPTEDSSVLLTTAGMQQFKEYFAEKSDPETEDHPNLDKPIGRRATSVQKCFRTTDIEEVGDASHLTFFEMLGNFSFRDYGKEEAIKFAHEFITDELGLEICYVTVYKPNIGPPDEESYNIWKDKIGIPETRILGEGEENFWGPTGKSGPCGPTTEIFVENSKGEPIEVWNIVFNQYLDGGPNAEMAYLDQLGVDTGMGLERIAMVSQGTSTIFETDLFSIPFEELFEEVNKRNARIVSDHLRGSAFLLADGVRPSNKKEGYILRRIIRRLVVHTRELSIDFDEVERYLNRVIDFYGGFYNELLEERENIIKNFKEELINFNNTLESALNKFNRKFPRNGSGKITGEEAFNLYQTYGLPLEIMSELANERGYDIDEEGFENAYKDHQEKSKG